MSVEPSGRTRARVRAGSGDALDVGRCYASDAAKPGVTPGAAGDVTPTISEEHTSQLQSLMRNSYAVFCFVNKTQHTSWSPTPLARNTTPASFNTHTSQTDLTP